jgi:hypothetical protein
MSNSMAGQFATQSKDFAFGEMFILTFLGFLILFQIFDLGQKAGSKEKIETEEVKTPSLKDLVNEKIGELRAVDAHSRMGGKLIENKDGIETYVWLAEVNKGLIESEATQKALKVQNRKFTALAVVVTLVTVIVLSIKFLM